MEAISNNPEANPQARSRDAVDEFNSGSIEGNTAGVAVLEAADEREKNEKARDRQEKIEAETTRCEKVLKDTSTGKQGRHK